MMIAFLAMLLRPDHENVWTNLPLERRVTPSFTTSVVKEGGTGQCDHLQVLRMES